MSKSPKEGWRQLKDCLLESNCGRVRVQKVYQGRCKHEYSYIAFARLTKEGWTQYKELQLDLTSAIDLCIEAISLGLCERKPVAERDPLAE